MDLFFSALRLSAPLLLAALGGLYSERSGVAMIALEGWMLFGAFAAAACVALCGNPYLGLAAALLVGLVLGALFYALNQKYRGDPIVIGTGMNILALGSIPLFSKMIFGVTGSTPALKYDSKLSFWFFFAMVILAYLGSHFLLNRTRMGLRLRACGENPEAAKSLSVDPARLRLRALLIAGSLASLAGAYLSICHGSQFIRNMVAGRGFMALAALILGGWRPLPVALACVVFGFADAMQIVLQGERSEATQLIQMIPYAVTILAVVVTSRKNRVPAALSQKAH